jgi:hypothetical protein
MPRRASVIELVWLAAHRVSSALHRCRRLCPVITSIRRYESPSCLASSMAFAIAAVLSGLHVLDRTGWLGISDSNRRIHRRAISLELRDNSA